MYIGKIKNKTSGLHIMGELNIDEADILTDISLIRDHLTSLIDDVGLTEVGSMEHVFPGGGYTLSILLAESHVCIHTWPEYKYLTLDVFVCNVERDNSGAARQLFEKISSLYNPTQQTKKEVVR